MNDAQNEGRAPVSPEALLRFGATEIAYVKPGAGVDGAGYAIHIGDGRKVAVADNAEQAIALIRANDLTVAALN